MAATSSVTSPTVAFAVRNCGLAAAGAPMTPDADGHGPDADGDQDDQREDLELHVAPSASVSWTGPTHQDRHGSPGL